MATEERDSDVLAHVKGKFFNFSKVYLEENFPGVRADKPPAIDSGTQVRRDTQFLCRVLVGYQASLVPKNVIHELHKAISVLEPAFHLSRC